MHRSAESEGNYIVYHFEMGAIPDRVYANIPFENNAAAIGNRIQGEYPEGCAPSNNAGTCPAGGGNFRVLNGGVPGRGDRAVGLGRKDTGRPSKGVHDYENTVLCNNNTSPAPMGGEHCHCAMDSNGGTIDKKEESLQDVKQGKGDNQKRAPGGVTPVTRQPDSFLSSPVACVMAVLISLMAAISLVLVILMMNGNIVSSNCCGSLQGNTVPTRICDLPVNIEDMKLQIMQLKKELNLTRYELKVLKEAGNDGKDIDKLEDQVTRGMGTLTARVENMEKKSNKSNQMAVQQSNELASLEMSLNSTREAIMMKLLDATVFVNSTDRKLRDQKNATEQELNELWSAINSTQKHVTENVEKLTIRLGNEEQKSNKSSELVIMHDKAIFALEMLLNSTRQDMWRMRMRLSVNSSEKEFREQADAIWALGNYTQKELRRLWKVVNTTQIELQHQLTQVKDNFSAQVINASKRPGPVGPQGPTGPQGPAGPGNLSLCEYKIADSGGITPGPSDDTDVTVKEPPDKKIVGATCSTNIAEVYIFSSIVGNSTIYKCYCKGESTSLSPPGSSSSSMHCYLHYWECPLIT